MITLNVQRKLFKRHSSWKVMNEQFQKFHFDLENIDDDKYDSYFYSHDDGVKLRKPLKVTLCKLFRVSEDTLSKKAEGYDEEWEEILYDSLASMKTDDLRGVFKDLTSGNYKLSLSVDVLENEDGCEELEVVVEDIVKL